MNLNMNMNMNLNMNPMLMNNNNNNSGNNTRMMGAGGGDLVLKPACDGCGATTELYGSTCKHRTLCLSCGKSLALSRARCPLCAAPITHLIREYNVRANATQDKNFSIGRFVTGLPPFSKKKSAENKWSLHKDGLQGRELTNTLREKLKNKPWILEDETGQHQYQGQMEGTQSRTATYYLLMLHGKEFLAYPATSWYNFSKIAQYKQLTLEEAEEKMNKRRHNATGYQRWMMKAAANGAAAFSEGATSGDASLDGSGKRGSNTKIKEEEGEEGNDNIKGEGEEDEFGNVKKEVLDDDDDDEFKGNNSDFDLEDEIEKGDDWEHEETFTDDDEAVGNDPDEREDLAPEIPAPPEIKQDDDDEEEEEENGGLSKSGKELKKLLGKAAGLNESDAEEEDDDDDEDEMSPVLAPKKEGGGKDESGGGNREKSPNKVGPAGGSGSARGTPSASNKSSKGGGKRKPSSNDEAKSNTSKKSKTDNSAEAKVGVKEPSSSKPSTSQKEMKANKSGSGNGNNASSSSGNGSQSPVTEDEIRAVLLSVAPITAQDLVARFKARLKTPEDKKAFADILKKISKIQKKANGRNYVVLQ